MKKIHLSLLFCFSLLLLGKDGYAQQKPVELGITEEIELFDNSYEFEEPLLDIPVSRTRKPVISLQDIPFYTKLVCSYVYEEKLKKWYAAAVGWLSSSPQKIKARKKR